MVIISYQIKAFILGRQFRNSTNYFNESIIQKRIDIGCSAELEFVSLINAYPNPSGGAFTLSLNLDEQVGLKIMVMNVLGQIVYSENLGNRVGEVLHRLPLGGNSPGVYSLHLITSKGSSNMNLVIN